MPLVELDGLRFHYQQKGQGQDVILLHAVTGNMAVWMFINLIEVLAEEYRVTAYDLRGHGDTLATEGDYSMELLVRDLTGLLSELNIEKTHLVGLGLGGAIVQAFAIENPQRVNTLMPCCCRAKMVPEFAAMWQKLREAVANEGVEVIVEPTVQRWFSDEFKAANPKVLQDVRNMIRATTTLGYLGVTAAFLGLNLEDKLPQIKAPTLYISGAEDKMGGPPALMAELAKKVPRAQHRSVPKAAHIANIQNPAGFNKEVGDFLKRQI